LPSDKIDRLATPHAGEADAAPPSGWGFRPVARASVRLLESTVHFDRMIGQ